MISKTSKKRRRIRVDNNPDNPTTRLIADDVVVVLLRRLPVKSLMCFKCVCKRWKLIIEDPHFIHSHLTHSKTRPGLFVLLPKSTSWEGGCARDYESFISADLHFSGRAANVHTMRKTKLSYRQILGPITGLVCFVGNCAVQIHNVSTMESTPWIKSKVCMNLEKDDCIVNILEEPRCYFGFDPTTKKHKAIFVWWKNSFMEKINLITDCGSILNIFVNWKCTHVPRDVNHVAHKLAKHGKEINSEEEWSSSLPAWILQCIQRDESM
ncbi:hypothetical protein MKW98_005387 [Papaver atlanticum]|uniref:F-box domain-containing protein n=1 Tax=Papaver atlanticum TaxID=357466 RepID=A0AAD4RX22_9MAGN|nr:hypothetical protein MKW98_005387 [Papaver atlanticum]